MKRILIFTSVLVWVAIGYANEEITVDLPGGETMEFVWIESGTFAMGSLEVGPPNWHLVNERPQHEVRITEGFYLGKYEVTQEQWESVLGTQPWRGQDWVTEGAEHPAVYISWDDARDLIRRLNEAAEDFLYRLPTEAEWEWACRAGTTTQWHFGDDPARLEDYAWYMDNTTLANQTFAHAVGIKLPNAWGLYDMHGNVWEWCQDWYSEDYYFDSPSVDPGGPATGTQRTLRGGGFFIPAELARSAVRSGADPDFHWSGNLGARLLRMGPRNTAIAPESWGKIKADY
jgi:formylglycine-generating enzyme required for sulfatase activity